MHVKAWTNIIVNYGIERANIAEPGFAKNEIQYSEANPDLELEGGVGGGGADFVFLAYLQLVI